LSELKTKLALEETAAILAKERLQLERSNQELEQFAGVAAHDLRSPIATIFSWADMLNHLLPPPRTAELDQAVDIIRNNAKKACDLVDDVLRIARVNVSVSHIDVIDLNRTLSEILVTLQREIKDVQTKIHIGPLPTVQGNQTYMASIFSNLIRNALIYRDKTRTPEITVGYTEHIDSYEFFVKDNGIGIDPKFTGRIFEMFKRLNSEKEYPGTGIGLAFCKKVVELSGGKIWVDSAPGQGSTFFFTYPKVWGSNA
jgi:light-regulated signal transduction histidine kinase (bacteriophytochrome)